MEHIDLQFNLFLHSSLFAQTIRLKTLFQNAIYCRLCRAVSNSSTEAATAALRGFNLSSHRNPHPRVSKRRRLLGQTICLISDQGSRTDLYNFLLRSYVSPLNVPHRGGFPAFYFPDRLMQVVRVDKRHPVDRAHRGTDDLRAVNIS